MKWIVTNIRSVKNRTRVRICTHAHICSANVCSDTIIRHNSTRNVEYIVRSKIPNDSSKNQGIVRDMKDEQFGVRSIYCSYPLTIISGVVNTKHMFGCSANPHSYTNPTLCVKFHFLPFISISPSFHITQHPTIFHTHHKTLKITNHRTRKIILN